MSDIINAGNATYNEMHVFAGRSFDADSRFSLVLELDENRIAKSDKKKLIQLMSKCHQEFLANKPELLKNFQFVYMKRSSEQTDSNSKWQIYIRDDLKYAQRIKLHSISSQKQLAEMNLKPEDSEPHSYVYTFPSETQTPDVESVSEWVKTVEASQAKESFKS